MVVWWQRVIDFLIEFDHRVYTTPETLTAYLSVYHLKPTPLPNIVQHLGQQETLVPENESGKRRFREEMARQNSGWMNSLFSLVKGPAAPPPIFTLEPKEKLFSKKIKEFKKEQARKAVIDMFGQHIKSRDEFGVVRELEGRLELDMASVQ